MLRRVRGALVLTVTWAMGWGALGAAVGVVRVAVLVRAGVPLERVSSLVPAIAQHWALYGAIGGILFSGALTLAGRRPRSVEALAPRRTARWGAGVGTVVAALVTAAPLALGGGPLSPVLAILFISLATAVGAATAGGVVHIAQRAPATRPAALGATHLPPAG